MAISFELRNNWLRFMDRPANGQGGRGTQVSEADQGQHEEPEVHLESGDELEVHLESGAELEFGEVGSAELES